MEKTIKNNGSRAFFVVVFLNAFVDLGHKIAIQNTVFKLYEGSFQILLTAIVNSLILLPFILLLSPAGFVSDRFRKTGVMRAAAWVAVICCCLITICYYRGWFWPAFAMTFLLAAQSAIYSPAKYGFIKEHFGKAKLGEVNGIVAMLSIVAILAGTFIYSIGFEFLFPADAVTESDVLRAIAPVGWLLIASAAAEVYTMYRIPHVARPETVDGFPWTKFLSGRLMMKNLSTLKQSRAVWLSTIGLAVFWAVGQVMLATFPAFLKDNMGVENTIVVQGILACSGIGIAFGSIFAGRFSRNYIETGLLPIGALGLACGLLALPSLESPWTAGLFFLFIGFMGGIFIVPLNALIQFFAGEKVLGRTLAASNWVQNLNMLFFLFITALFSFQGWTSKALLQLIAVVALIGSFYTIYQLPQSLTRFLLSSLVSSFYRIRVVGLKNIPAQGGVLMLGNHVSWIDWAIIQIASPRPVRFVMTNNVYRIRYLKWFFDQFGTIPITAGAASRGALDRVSEALSNGEVVCLFPEGTISRNGHLAEFKKGYERACENAGDDVVILPFYLRGLWGSKFSRSAEHLKRSGGGLSRDIVVGFGKKLPKTTDAATLKQKVLELSIQSWNEYVDTLPTLGEQWVDTCRRPGNPVIISDTMGDRLKAKDALAGSILIAGRIGKTSQEKAVGILLPSSAGCMLTNMACMLAGKTVVNLNFTAGRDALLSAIEQAGIKTVYTSSRFLKKLAGKGVDLEFMNEHVAMVMLEDVQSELTWAKKLWALIRCTVLPASLLKKMVCKDQAPGDTAVILFSSGSEGAPKGVELTHKNIMSNVKQVTEMLNLGNRDVMLSNLPPFHAFGLTGALFLPLLERVPVVCHADPTDVFTSAKAIAEHQVTVMFGTPSFLRLYIRNRKVHPLMLQSLRFIVAGAEKLQPEIRTEFKLKFNKDILEGYGATETSPVAAVNLPDILSSDNWRVQVGNKTGSVGMPLPGTSFRIVDPESFAPMEPGEPGMILIAGPQVMKGYLNNEKKSAEVLKDIDGMRWYVSGDKGYLDADGFLFIQDRYSRFAKIAGEMVSLGKVEASLKEALDDPEAELVALNMADEKKGESIVVLCNRQLDGAGLREKLSAGGLNPLAFPDRYLQVEAIPKLGSGKTDFSSAKKLAMEMM